MDYVITATKVGQWIRMSEFVYWENFIDIIIYSEVTCLLALCYLSLIVVDKCIVVSCTCTANIDEGLQEGWNEVCRT